MNDDVRIPVTRQRIIARGFAEFFADLAAGDPVAIGILLGLVLFFAIIGLLGVWILYSRKKAAEAHKKKIKDRQKRKL